MNRKDWSDFNKKNKDTTTAFENMCRVLFLRKFNKNAYDYEYDYNHPGLEFAPVFCNNIKNCDYTEGLVGIQCKYTTTNDGEAVYKEVWESLEKVKKYYCSNNTQPTLKQIYIYTNANIKTDTTIDTINKEQKKTTKSVKKTKKTNRSKILSFEDDSGIKLIWQKSDNIFDDLISPRNIDLYKLYFDDSRELNFIDDTVSIEDRTFILSDEFINLHLNNDVTASNLKENMDGKVCLLLGQAGTGKSMIMKKLHYQSGIDFINYYFNKNSHKSNLCIPMLIKLRECINGSLESLINERQRLYNLNLTKTPNDYIYLLDGFDEVSYENLGNVLSAIDSLNSQKSTKQIIISSRSGSNNLLLLTERLETVKYTISKLTIGDIKNYFKIKENDLKKIKYESLISNNSKILTEIEDVFSLKLFWDNIENIDLNTTRICLIQMSFKHYVMSYSKLSIIPLPQPFYTTLVTICKELALFMQKNAKLTVEINELQNIISKLYTKMSYSDTNSVINCLSDICLESSLINDEDIVLAFKHRRFQEYFLYEKLEELYFTDPSIFRKLKLLPNRDFIMNVFLTQSLLNAKKDNDIFKYLSLKLFECYLKPDYWYNYQNDLVGKNYIRGYVDPDYSYSTSLLHALAAYDEETLKQIIENRNLEIIDSITSKNIFNFMKIFHNKNNKYIGEYFIKKNKIEGDKIDVSDMDCDIYFRNKIKNISIDTIYDEIKNIDCCEIHMKHLYFVDSQDQGIRSVHSFYKFLLDYNSEFLMNIISELSEKHLEILCYEIIASKNILFLLSEDLIYAKIRDEILKHIEQGLENNYLNTIVFNNFIKNSTLDIAKIEKEFKLKNVNRYIEWEESINTNKLMAIILGAEDKLHHNHYKLDVELLRVVKENHNNKQLIFDKWIEIIQKYNFKTDNFFIFNHSKDIGNYICYLDFDFLETKCFLSKLKNYPSVISMQTVYYTIYQNNFNLFTRIANKSILNNMITSIDNSLGEYLDQSESDFQLSAMFSAFDKDNQFKYLLDGINNTILRPNYRSEDLLTFVLPQCLFLAHQNNLYSYDETIKLSNLLFELFMIVDKTTDHASHMNIFKSFLKYTQPDSPILDKMNEISETDINDENYSIIDYTKTLSIYKIDEYYTESLINQKSNYPYATWEILINAELLNDPELTLLYSKLKESNFPGAYSFSCSPMDNFSFITAILLKNTLTEMKFKEFIIKAGGQFGLYNLIVAYLIIGKTEQAKIYIDFLFQFAKSIILNSNYNLTPISLENDKVLFDVFHSHIDDWYSDEYNGIMTLKSNANISINWDTSLDKEPCNQQWATKYSNKKAYCTEYHIQYKSKILKSISLVDVDGDRATLPFPKNNTMIVSRNNFYFSRLFNNDDNELRRYLNNSGLIIE